MLSILSKSIQIPEIRNRVLITLGVLAVYRFLAHIPLPMVDISALRVLFDNSQFLSFLNLFTGGGLKNLSIVALGIGPYINASIFVQLFIMINPKLEEMIREGTVGRQKINLYTQLLTLPIALIQSYGIYVLLKRQDFQGLQILPSNSPWDLALFMLIVTGGAFVLMWLAEIITERGIGNGMSIMVFAGILTGIPGGIGGVLSLLDLSEAYSLFIFVLVGLGVISGVVFINESFRKVDVHYSAQSSNVRGQIAARSYIPIKINQSGVFPLIFAVSLVLLPGLLGTFLQQVNNPQLQSVGFWLATNFQTTGVGYNIAYFLLVFLFTFFYTNVAFNPQKIADDIRRNGGFITGIRPGRHTVDYLRYVINRLTLAGGFFLGTVAVIPSVIQNATGITSLAIGGTGVLIVVSVVLETVKQLESKVITQEYNSVYK